MQAAPHRTTVRGPAFVRLITRLAHVDAPQSGASLPDRLSHWLDWKQAIALSTALDGTPSDPASGVPTPGGTADDECARARAALVDLIAADRAFAPGVQRDTDYAPLRQRYIALQRRIQATTGSLRGTLRDMLAGMSPERARLAEVDAVMEVALSPREQALLGKVPTLLGEYFDRLRRGSGQGPGPGPGTPTSSADTSAAWLDVFRKDMQSVLLAELDVRFQPVEGLLAALRAS